MKEAIALLINDIHVNKDNIAEFNKNWDEMLSVCQREGVEEVVIAGDMFTTRAAQTLSTLLAVKAALTKAVSQGVYVTIGEGNHDKTDQEAIEGYNHLWSGLQGIEVVDVYKALVWDGCDFCLLLMSYFPENGSFLDKLEAAVNNTLEQYPQFTKNDIILYIHEGVHGALGDFEIDGELPQAPLLDFKAVLCGHYHNRVKIKNTNIEYIGSSRQGNFGEDEEKGYTLLYADGSYGFVKNEVNTRYQTIELDAKSVEKFTLDKDDRYKYKVKVKCDDKQAKMLDKQKLIDLGFHKVEVVAASNLPNESAAADIHEKYDKQGIKKEYQNYCNENAIDSKLGIKYLEG
ncbi:metallophosphoesterase [uncultured Duncaniella sp.]|uniref:metallophosphoesterase family protein n=1 Tax=uncultured Duncaniella sp. TaxID=2768039 RepID=UPI00272A8023|nr:metallophosphoesterase [uncultured Duncaniella sp.]